MQSIIFSPRHFPFKGPVMIQGLSLIRSVAFGSSIAGLAGMNDLHAGPGVGKTQHLVREFDVLSFEHSDFI